MKTWIIINKTNLQIMGSYVSEEKDETSDNNRSYLFVQPHYMHLELPENIEEKYAVCEIVEGVATLVHSEAKELEEVSSAWMQIRNQRNIKLIETDKYVLPDYPISAEDLQAVKDYRTSLRDFPSQVVDPCLPQTWPTEPLHWSEE